MTPEIFSIVASLENSFRKALGDLGADEGIHVSIDRPKEKSHGDFSTPVALVVGKRTRRPPMGVAQDLLSRVELDKNVVLEAVVAEPGFINLRLSPGILHAVLERALSEDRDYGKNSREKGNRFLLEFVSANPTGPLNVVNARAAVLGDAIANLLTVSGAEVDKEYYVNDAGVQARLFGESLEAAIGRVRGVPKPAPEGGYQGSYMEDLANAYLADKDELPDPDFNTSCQKLGEWGMDQVIQWHQRSLSAYGVSFDRWYSEKKELHEKGLVKETLEALKGSGLTYEKDGAVWIKVSEHGAPKDEVLVKSDGAPAYFAADIAYHRSKFGRGYGNIVDIWGPDHHGHVQRMKSALAAMGLPVEHFMVLIAQQVNLLENGQKVKMSKREGKFVTMDELLEQVGKDAARFFFVMRGANSHLDFDIEVARKRTEENPVYYVQYAHARICSLIRKCAEKNLVPAQKAADFSPLTEPEAVLLLKEIMEYPQWVAESGKAYEPHRIVVYLQNLAADFHHFYSKHRILDADPGVAGARLGLALGVKTVIHNALALLGVSAPEQM